MSDFASLTLIIRLVSHGQIPPPHLTFLFYLSLSIITHRLSFWIRVCFPFGQLLFALLLHIWKMYVYSAHASVGIDVYRNIPIRQVTLSPIDTRPIHFGTVALTLLFFQGVEANISICDKSSAPKPIWQHVGASRCCCCWIPGHNTITVAVVAVVVTAASAAAE